MMPHPSPSDQVIARHEANNPIISLPDPPMPTPCYSECCTSLQPTQFVILMPCIMSLPHTGSSEGVWSVVWLQCDPEAACIAPLAQRHFQMVYFEGVGIAQQQVYSKMRGDSWGAAALLYTAQHWAASPSFNPVKLEPSLLPAPPSVTWQVEPSTFNLVCKVL